MEWLFWIFIALLAYTFVGYGAIITILNKVRVRKHTTPTFGEGEWPSVALVIAAYNEEDYISEKIENSLALPYPGNKEVVIVTDGSNDNTPGIVASYTSVRLMHTNARSGKINAIHRAMHTVKADIVVFSDANTTLNEDALINIVRHYADPTVGGVAGEKRIKVSATDQASGAGEGAYWKYESFLKRQDSNLKTAIGAAGELFSVRRSLYQPVESDTILDDFMISMHLVEEGYRLVYEPDAYAMEEPSFSIADEWKRKTRISAGGWQSMVRLKTFFNPVQWGVVSWMFISHRVLRWAFSPLALPIVWVLNLVLALQQGGLYTPLLTIQTSFYLMAGLGWYLAEQKIKVKVLFIPFYFVFMHVAAIVGMRKYWKGQQAASWEKVKRRQVVAQV